MVAVVVGAVVVRAEHHRSEQVFLPMAAVGAEILVTGVLAGV